MSLFTFLAADYPLPVLDLTGLVTMKVKDIKKMDPLPSGPVPWDELDDELDVRYTANKSAMDYLQIAVCKYPPDGLDAYIRKPYIYWVGGSFNPTCREQLFTYLKDQLPHASPVELWSILFGQGIQVIESVEVELMNITAADLEWIEQGPCRCMVLI
ncbi:hypothetical protein ASG89_25760 [Paenibacillus sp. Soil766]|uniref:hypothetical protein n=1 Tax=Paenibacillus sp. Soil766 TaxID=1736404 RepID=UPI00070B46EA|nr:hypothetical protein [Paenibacillus sp. Soil766]KRF01767.1 hypothetical protein ASG89_25760 [Paenibacillus sp. Soil766]